LKWEQGLFEGKLLQPASLQKMTTPFLENYAFGVAAETVAGHKVISHNGGIEGFNTRLVYYPDDKVTVIVLSNVNGSAPVELGGKLAGVAFGEAVKLTGERSEITLSPGLLDRYSGAYQLAPGAVLVITRDKNQLIEKLGTQPELPIFPESETLFFLKAVDAQLEFPKLNGEEKPTQVTLHQGGRDMVAKRLDPAEEKKYSQAPR